MNDISRNKETYDAYAKAILSKKSVLAYILMYLVPDYKDMNVNKILSYIEDGSDKQIIQGITNSDVSTNEKEIKFDIIFKAISPIDNKAIYINIEPQYYETKYSIEKRAEVYLGRCVDIQNGIEFTNSNYNEIKRVYTIWIVMNHNNQRNYLQKNIENKYHIVDYDSKTHSFKTKIDENNKSVFNVIVLHLGKLENINGKSIFELLYLLLTYDKEYAQTRTKILKTKFGIIINDKEHTEMCSLAEGIERKGRLEGINQGRIEGISQGRLEGISQGRLEGNVDTVINLINRAKMSLDDAIYNSGIDDSIKEEVIKQVKLKLN